MEALEFARTLKKVIAAQPRIWARHALQAVPLLREPIYIAHLILGLSEQARDLELAETQLVELLELALSHPWTPIPLGDDKFDYDPDWSEVDSACIAAIEAFANADAKELIDWEHGWEFLEHSWAHSAENLVTHERFDEMTTALNSTSCQALRACLALGALHYRSGASIPDRLSDLLDKSLALTSEIALPMRAIVVSHLPMLRTIMPTWTEQSFERLFGAEAPSGLGPETIVLALRWSLPTNWLLVKLQKPIYRLLPEEDAALPKALVGALRGLDGYQPEQLTVAIMRSASEGTASRTGAILAKMVQQDGLEQGYVDRALQIWELAIDAARPGTDLSGFGRWYEALCVDEEQWMEMSLNTLSKTGMPLDIPWEIAARIARNDPSALGLRLLDALMRFTDEEWQRSEAGTHALHVLERAKDRSDLRTEWEVLRKTLGDLGFHPRDDL
nr:hypothetical protein 6 [Pseudomonadaceae bacterium]